MPQKIIKKKGKNETFRYFSPLQERGEERKKPEAGVVHQAFSERGKERKKRKGDIAGPLV